MTAVAITARERADVVSQLAKGFRVDQIASSLRVPSAAVIALRSEYGTDLGVLAKVAEQLRSEAYGTPAPSVDATLAMLKKAAEFPKLAAKAAKTMALIAEITAGMADVEKAAKLAAIVAKRKADLAEAERQLAELTGGRPRGIGTGHHGLSPENAQIRAWAAANGVECPSLGRIPGRVLLAWKAAQK